VETYSGVFWYFDQSSGWSKSPSDTSLGKPCLWSRVLGGETVETSAEGSWGPFSSIDVRGLSDGNPGLENGLSKGGTTNSISRVGVLGIPIASSSLWWCVVVVFSATARLLTLGLHSVLFGIATFCTEAADPISSFRIVAVFFPCISGDLMVVAAGESGRVCNTLCGCGICGTERIAEEDTSLGDVLVLLIRRPPGKEGGCRNSGSCGGSRGTCNMMEIQCIISTMM